MNDDNMNKNKDDLWIKSMMESVKKEPTENLSYRIMHQIETEQAFSRAKPKLSKQKDNSLVDLRNVFGLMYLVLLITGGYFFLQGGKEALFTGSFLWTCITIGSIFSVYFLIITIDNSLRNKQKNKSSTSK
ncbi:MAG: hypothetical protein PHI32_04595 [Dysgonamonadaceae bacterium]|nr:hypothetical protein [Dysgonamonadaceae bacterium]MDD4727384.1 hypothetical protein [Dysgonamonadaceae bacterium]